MLQQGWFKVTNIPDDQRDLVTLAKVGGLVGKVTEIDEKARFRVDYVRMRIACRDITKVPKTAEGVLGLTVYDFGFEREILEGSNEKTLKSGIVVSDDQPPNKKQRADNVSDFTKLPKSSGNTSEAANMKSTGKQVLVSAPSKI